MGSALGAAKTAAIKVGCTVEEWTARRANGERWCTVCRQWWFVENMQPERRRPGGIGCTCRACFAVGRERMNVARETTKDGGA